MEEKEPNMNFPNEKSQVEDEPLNNNKIEIKTDLESNEIEANEIRSISNSNINDEETKSTNSDQMVRSSSSINFLDLPKSSQSSTNIAYEQELQRLRELIEEKNNENTALEAKLNECEYQSKMKIELLNQNFTQKLEQTLKKFQEGHKDKTSSLVMKYAEGEKRCIDLNRNIEFLQSKLNDSAKEKQRVDENLLKAKSDIGKLNTEYEKKIQEVMSAKKEYEKLKENIVLSDAREKAAQLKLKHELEAHLNTKRLLEQATNELIEIKKKIPVEGNQMNEATAELNADNCNESEQSALINSGDEKLENENEFTIEPVSQSNIESGEVKKPLNNDVKAAAQTSSTQKDRTLKELYALKSQLKDMFEERTTLRDRLQCMDQERKSQEISLNKYKEILQSQKLMNKDLLNEILQLRESQETMEKEKHERKIMEKKIEQLTSELSELQAEMNTSQSKQTELLSFTSKLTEKNTQLQSENTMLNEKCEQINMELTSIKDSLHNSNEAMKLEVNELNKKLSEELKKNVSLNQRLDEKLKQLDEVSIKLSDVQDENNSLKKKHAANIKDLSKQLQTTQKKLNSLASTPNTTPNASAFAATSNNQQNSLGSSNTNLKSNNSCSRTNSISSLNEKDHHYIDTNNVCNSFNSTIDEDTRSLSMETSSSISHGGGNSNHFNEIICGNDDVYVVDIDKQKIIEKIVKLQKTLARRNEKIDFLQDHVNQLTSDLKRKTKIIQAYAMNEEVGAFTSEAHDAIKLEMSRKTGIMSTLYNTNKSYMQTTQLINSNESNMTMDLCLEINRKLQALLEDTLIKNITLKDSLETLGQEIARLSKENRKIQLDNR